jgi:hypothetical protein
MATRASGDAVLVNLTCLPADDKLLDEKTNQTPIIDGMRMIRDSKSKALVARDIARLSAGQAAEGGRCRPDGRG